MVKLTDKKMRWIVRYAGQDASASGAARIYASRKGGFSRW